MGGCERARAWIDVVRTSTSLARFTKRRMSMRTGVPKQTVTAIACGAKCSVLGWIVPARAACRGERWPPRTWMRARTVLENSAEYAF
eukprot:scaffold3005_cov109-Isochrysis_galbana.AAC.6